MRIEYEMLNKYINLVRKGENNQPVIDAPEEYLVFSFLTIMSAILNKKVYINFASKKIYPNLWTVLVGKSSLYRKSTSINMAVKVLRKINENLLLPSEFSLERLFQIISEREVGLFWIDEFSSFFSQFHRGYMTGGTSFFLQLYEGDLVIKRELIKGQYEIREPCISIISATTLDGITASLKERELRTGLLPRFNFVVALNDRTLIPFPDNISERKFLNFMDKIFFIETHYDINRGNIEITEKARKIYERKFNETFANKELKLEPDLSAFLIRIFNSILKIALICAFLEKRKEIIEKDMRFAIECGDILINSTKIILNQLCWTKQEEKKSFGYSAYI